MAERVLTVGGNRASKLVADFAGQNIGLGKAFYVDPTNGDDGRSGRSPETAVKTLSVGYGLLTTGSNDVLYIIPGTSGLTITTAMTWSKSYCHLVGLSAECMNPRARISNSGETIANLLSITGSGCIFKNFRIGNYGTGAAALGTAIITGGRNHFENVTFFGPGHATPAAETGSRALVLNGAEENRFVNCYIGGDTIARTAANFIMEIKGGCVRNEFIKCKFISMTNTAAYAMIKITNEQDRFHLWDNCIFYNFSTNHAVTLTEVFDVTVSVTQDHAFINPALIGIAELDAGDVAGFVVVGPATAATCGIGVVPTT
ncbi:MAG: hypothetical protein L7F78_07705 [Syntrophales bacterium LBB04]|nr:hypothetical protein [Syntrophales bacterium LBB04]